MRQPQPETRIASNVAEKAKAGLIKHLESSVANSDQNTRETPRVDSIAFLAGSTVIGQWVVNKRRAQEIERENNQLRAECDGLDKARLALKCAAESTEARLMESDKLVEKYATDLAFSQSKLAEAEKDKARLDKVFLNGWQISYKRRAQTWIVQQPFQTVGNIGNGNTLHEAIDTALKRLEERV